MRGASAESLAVLTDALGTAIDGGADPTTVADDLFAASDVLRREPGFRRIATDVSIDPAAKAELVGQIFGGKLDPVSVELVGTATGRHWAGSRDLGDALEQLGVIAVVRAAEQAGQADELEDELFAFQQLVSDNPGLRDALSDPARSVEDKRALVHQLIDGKVTATTLRLAEQSIAGTHRTVALALEAYQKVAAEHRHRLVATVRVAQELEEQDAERLVQLLAEQYGRPVHLNMVVDPDVIGGVMVEIGDDVIDGTVSSRLDEARRRLAG